MGHDTRYERIRFAFLERRFYLGLFVLLPLFFSVFALAAPLIFLTKFRTVLQHHIVDARGLLDLYESAEKWTYIFTGVAFIAGLVVAYALIRPAKKLLRENRGYKDIEEFSALGKEFAEIATSFRKYTSLLESTTGGIMAVNKNGEIIMANPHACHILGCPEPDVMGKNIGTLLYIPKDFERVMRGEIITSELNMVINGERRTIGYTLSPVKGKDAIDGAVFNFMDTTKIKEMHQEIQKTERLAGIGALAMEVAHEVRNPLASIKGLAQMIREDVKDDEQKLLYIDTILKETDRLNRVVDTLFEKKTASYDGDNLREMIHRVVLLCGHAVQGKVVRITEKYDEIADKIQVKDERLFHAIYNIVLNAYEATREDGEISIKAWEKDAGTIIEISSDSDLGPGLMADKIFEADVTTKGAGHGMGLKIARDAIRNLGGEINVEAEEGKIKFIIKLPQA
ncbi:MAG: histidine kinase dimerization/phospho-acceptor domain-containing protein [Thermodesulfovibrionales bacterium]|nr:histidine kinase dimerization/phospho-acceptor domain-containing protein [Thermodesulfovibrionales bacterium]